jgi:prepilin-type N-terminal cleavage/methylation domain-containing protein
VHRTAYTLIELLAVVVVLGMLASIGIPPLARAATGTPLERACRAVQTCEQRARQDARGTGVDLDLTADGIHPVGAPPAEALVGPEVALAWRSAADAPLRRLHIDRHARSVDLVVEIRHGELRRRFLVSGISGEWTEALAAAPVPAPAPP